MEQIPVQPPTINPSPVTPSQKKINIRKFFNISSWIVLFALLPVTILIFLSQNSIPGDFFYPVKRSLENVVLAAASVNPATRAAFRTDLTEARFKEAQSLVVSQSNASGLTAFIDDVQSTKQEVANLKDDTQRVKAEEKLINKLEEYQAGLSTLEAKTEQNIITYQFTETSTTTPIPPTSAPNLPSAIPTFTLTPTSIPAPPQFQPTSTLTPSPTLVPTAIPTVPVAASETASVQVLEQRKIAESIRETRQEINKIKRDLEEKREKRSEQKEKREKRNEDEQRDKKDGEKKDNFDRNK